MAHVMKSILEYVKKFSEGTAVISKASPKWYQIGPYVEGKFQVLGFSGVANSGWLTPDQIMNSYRHIYKGYDNEIHN